MKMLILIRHGETQKVNSSNRALTKQGIKEVKKQAQRIKNFINKFKTVSILHSDTYRAEQTAQLIYECLNSLFNTTLHKEDLRILNGDSIKELVNSNEEKGVRPAKTYLNLGEFTNIESPRDLTLRWNSILEKYKFSNVIILVSHEGSLEAFLENTKLNLRYKTFDEYFEYADFCILE